MTEARRDRWGRYYVLPPGEHKPVGYTRATTVAKSLDDGGGLIPWKATLAVTGLLRRPGLRGRFEALLSQHPEAGPWYGSAESKAASKALIEECAEAGGSSDRADQGTALHSMVEQINRGQAPLVSQESTRADLDAYQRTIAAAGVTFDPSLIECMVVLDEFGVAGTMDIGCADVPGVGKVPADLKTGADLKYSWQAISVQKAIYANADNVYIQGAAADGSQDQRLPMPDISREVGLIIHLPASEARCDLWLVDLVAGWEAFQHSMWARAWRTRKDLARSYQIVQAATTTAFVVAPAPPPFNETSAGAPPTAADPQPGPVASLALAASSGPPPFDEPAMDTSGSGAATTSGAIAQPTRAEQRAAMPGRPDEGADGDAGDFDVLQRRYEALDTGARAWFTALVGDAIKAGVSFHAREAKTVRRSEIIRGLLALAGDGGADDELLRALVALALGSDAPLFPAITAGHAVGALDAMAAATFAQLADALLAGRLVGLVGDDELFRLQPAGA